MNSHEQIEARELKQQNDMKQVKWMNEEMNWLKKNDWNSDLKSRNWNQWAEVNELKSINQNEGLEIRELKWMNWHELLDRNGLKWMKWYEWIDMNERDESLEIKKWKWMNYQKWSETLSLFFFDFSYFATWMFFCWRMKLNSRYSYTHFVHPIFQKWSEPANSFHYLFWNRSSHYSLVHILPVSSSKSGLSRSSFYMFFLWNRALATVSCTFCRYHLPKVVWAARQFLSLFIVKSSSRYSLMRILSTTFCDRGAHLRNRDPPAATTDGHLPEKKQAPRECFQAWIHAFPIPHTSQLLDDDAVDMMIEMMMWLSWWWDS